MHKKQIAIIVLIAVVFAMESFYSPKEKKLKTDNLKESEIQKAGFSLEFKKEPVVVNPDTLTWKLLGEIKFLKKQDKTYGEVQFPVINTKLKQMQKKRIVMSGFIVPIDNKSYALSKNVFASCFFCGKSGPETIMGIKFRGGNPKLRTDQYVTLEGTFRYNDNNVDDWIYHIEDAVIVKGGK
ncbi:hypothetical protein IP98_01802 [Flavobacterium cauense R2A-7]|uniref:DUF3299 domain-containing protein n=1 Tax=Flavobacterium cauense R2A-7 TaxID=1341154 RepID=A0A562LX69_9FLAO|nr:hypothetical protein [Flavobacterium cauense]TWI12227.1 hypothetical protein IP98_01802 [Flavobacterium cauense R2A-7]